MVMSEVMHDDKLTMINRIRERVARPWGKGR